MDIKVARFREVLGLLKPVVLRKTALEALTYVLLKDGQATATDLSTFVVVQVPEADANCLIPYAEVVKAIQYVYGMEYLHIEPANGKVTMSWSDGKTTFGIKDVKEFPPIPEFVPVAEASIDVDTLIPAMYEALGFVAKDDTRPVLGGVTLIMGDPIAVGGGDGFRMAYKTLDLAFPHESIFVVPPSSVRALKLLWEKTPRNPPAADELIPIIMAKKQASVALDGKTGLRFVFGDSATAIVKLVEGSPPAWTKLIPKGEPTLQAAVIGPQLELAVRRVLSVAKEGNNIVRLVFSEDEVTLSAKYEDQEAESTVQLMWSKGAPGRVGLNANYLLDYLRGREGLITISRVKDGPVSFKHQHGPTVLIMPMMVRWGEATGVPAEATEESSPPEDN